MIIRHIATVTGAMRVDHGDRGYMKLGGYEWRSISLSTCAACQTRYTQEMKRSKRGSTNDGNGRPNPLACGLKRKVGLFD